MRIRHGRANAFIAKNVSPRVKYEFAGRRRGVTAQTFAMTE